MWVAPFGNPRITGYLLLHAAYRSLSRPSSAPDAKAFPLRSFQLDLLAANSISLRFRRQPSGFLGNGDIGLRRVLTEIAILMNYAGFTKKFSKL